MVVARRKPLLSKMHITACLEFAKGHLKDPHTMRNKIRIFGLNVKRNIWRIPDTILMVKHGGGSIMLWQCYSGTGKLVRIEGKMNGAKYRESSLMKSLLQSTEDLRLGRRFTFQQDNDPKHTAKTTQEWLRDNSLNVLEWPSQSPDFNISGET